MAAIVDAMPRIARARDGGRALGRWPPGWHVRGTSTETGSTNADLLAAAAGRRARPHACCVADHQTAGRGRLDRRWDAPPGANLLVSMLFHDVPATRRTSSTRRVGAGRRRRRARRAPASTPRLKWPNDVLLDGAQARRHPRPARRPTGRVVVGIGLNVGWAPTAPRRLGDGVDPLDVLAALLGALDRCRRDVARRATGTMLATLGRHVRVELPAGRLIGTAVDVERDGGSSCVDDARSPTLDAGDVVHLRPPSNPDRRVRRPPLTRRTRVAGTRFRVTPRRRSRCRSPSPRTGARRAAADRGRRRCRGAAGVLRAADAGAPPTSSASTGRPACSRHPDDDASRPRTTCSSAPTREGTSIPTTRLRRDRRRQRGRRPAQRHDHDPAPGAGRRRGAAEPAPRPVGRDRRHGREPADQRRLQRRPERAGRRRSQQSLGIPIHHYVEVDFVGFKDSSTRSAASRCASWYAARDTARGLTSQPGCQTLDGVMALPTPAAATTRSSATADWQDGSDAPTSAGSSASSSSSATPSRRCSARCSRRRSARRHARGRRRARCGSTPGSTRSRPPQSLREAAADGLRTYSLPVDGRHDRRRRRARLGDGADASSPTSAARVRRRAVETVTDPALDASVRVA